MFLTSGFQTSLTTLNLNIRKPTVTDMITMGKVTMYMTVTEEIMMTRKATTMAIAMQACTTIVTIFE